jgi:TorA maturation chaperone TorD
MTPPSGRDRALAYGALACLLLPPMASQVEALRGEGLPNLRDAMARMGAEPDLVERVERLAARLDGAELEKLDRTYQEIFDPSGGLRCPPNETAYTAVTPQHGMTKSFELADIAGFYRAFGVEVTPGTERPDHIAVELEFMHLLAVKEMVAAAREDGEEHARICRDARATFFRDHLGRWFTPFCERLREEGGPLYGEAAAVLEGFLALESRAI